MGLYSWQKKMIKNIVKDYKFEIGVTLGIEMSKCYNKSSINSFFSRDSHNRQVYRSENELMLVDPKLAAKTLVEDGKIGEVFPYLGFYMLKANEMLLDKKNRRIEYNRYLKCKENENYIHDIDVGNRTLRAKGKYAKKILDRKLHNGPHSDIHYGIGVPGVYFFKAIGTDRVKIGFAKDWTKRILQIQTGCPYEVVCIHHIIGTTDDERRIHSMFFDSNVIGEWFILTKDIVNFINAGVLNEN